MCGSAGLCVFCVSCVRLQARLQARRREPRLCGLLSGSDGGVERDVFLLCQRRVYVRKQGTPDRRRARAQARDPLPQLKKYALEKGILTEQQARARAAGRWRSPGSRLAGRAGRAGRDCVQQAALGGWGGRC